MSLFIALGLAATTTLAQSPSAPSEVRLHIETDSPKLELYRVTSDGVGTVSTFTRTAVVGIVQYQRECFAPCDMVITEPRSDFFVAGHGITPSSRFSLLGQGEDLTLRVKPGSSAVRGLGWTSTVLGLSALTVAGAFFLVEASLGETMPANEAPARMALLGGGAALLGGGVTLLAFSGTDVEVLPTPKPAATPHEVL